MASMAPAAVTLILLLALVMMPTALCSRSGPSSKHGHGGHAKRAPPPSPASPPPAALVRATCNSTAYYDVCVAALAADPSSSTADVRGLSAIAVSVAAANASGAAQAAAALANSTGTAALADGTVQGLLRTCAAKYGDARDALAAAKESIAQQDYDFASVHVSAAAEYPQVCKALFRRQRPNDYPPELAAKEDALGKLCSVALDIIALLSSPSNNS
ncbi:pectinesterase inhibitor 28-like [Oryza brachyantha]|uniref:pectinesterase inhibitor 28-like n=1 Tax=Oryza brachyantha TaxID=4533 RepID=UPI001ADC3BBB|nr:pectinesterase inhibitor 28-like [Oryza brachyantha]